MFDFNNWVVGYPTTVLNPKRKLAHTLIRIESGLMTKDQAIAILRNSVEASYIRKVKGFNKRELSREDLEELHHDDSFVVQKNIVAGGDVAGRDLVKRGRGRPKKDTRIHFDPPNKEK